jgi:hypothetical protein
MDNRPLTSREASPGDRAEDWAGAVVITQTKKDLSGTLFKPIIANLLR